MLFKNWLFSGIGGLSEVKSNQTLKNIESCAAIFSSRRRRWGGRERALCRSHKRASNQFYNSAIFVLAISLPFCLMLYTFNRYRQQMYPFNINIEYLAHCVSLPFCFHTFLKTYTKMFQMTPHAKQNVNDHILVGRKGVRCLTWQIVDSSKMELCFFSN